MKRPPVTYRVTFADGLLGRRAQPPVEPFTIEAVDAHEFMDKIRKRCKTRLVSRDVDVLLDTTAGGIVTGGRVYVATIREVGTFTAEAQT